MKFTLETGTRANYVSACRAGAVRIGEREFNHSVVVLAHTLLAWPVHSAAALRWEDLQVVLEHEPDIILLGTGAAQVFPPFSIPAELSRRRVGFEAMDTAAACRTFNVLLAEDRRVAAALIIER